ncbi:chromosome segregation protein SMC [Spartobacteria bacterium LR76]|nr:chromosome segregation protein SMC [Spartobacteria bacterium LR76]
MYLQSLEMLGFKSFAPRTILNFHRGVTAVVGPNGCGKSNVLDAMRWVLGEQSAKALRGGEMSDVIFSGTDSRQALGMAEVSLTFAECEKELGVDWNEVCITRRVYRDGKSEYFLNKTPCRLKDIHQLFMDTGVGRSAYSIMEQGKIDLILSSRPEDRRAIFEEAAGITKYKAQKKEALRKLEYTEANLLRVQDIIKEVRRQIGSLQRQASKARRYQAFMQDLRIFDVHLSHKNYRQLSEELTTIRQQLDQGESNRGVHETEIAQQEAELSGYRARIDELDGQMGELRESIQNLRNRVFSAENRISTNAERCEEASTLIDRHRLDIAAAEEKIRAQQEQIEQTDILLEQMITTLRDHESTLNEHTDRVRMAREERMIAERQIQEINSEISRHEGRLGSLRNDISAAAGRREAGETRLRLLQGEAEAAAQAVGELQARLEEIRHREEASVHAVEFSQIEQSEAQSAYEAAQLARQNAENAMNAVSREATGIESRLEVLRQLQEQGEGYDEGTQTVLRGLDDPNFYRPAIQGALADNIQVEQRFIPAIEAALGSSLQAIIFKDSMVAEAAIATLAGKKLGKAALIPSEWIRPSEQKGDLLPEGAIAWASSCVNAEGDARAFAVALLADIAVVESLEAAFRIKAQHPYLGVVTLAGELITREGIVRGGASGENSGQSTLVRKAQIAELDEALTQVIQKLEVHAGTRADAMQALDDAQDRLLASRDALQHAQVESAAIQNEKKLAERQYSDLETRRESFARETVQLSESLRASLAHVQNLEMNIAEAASTIEQARVRRSDAENHVLVARERENVAVEQLNEVRVRVATERQQQENLSRQRGPMSARLAELAELLDARRQDISNYEARIDALQAESATLQSSIGEWQEEVMSLETQGAALVAARSEVYGEAEAIEIALRAARQNLVQLQEQRGRLEVRIAQVEMRMENLRNHVSQRYQTDLEAFEPDAYGLVCAYRERIKKRNSGGDAAAVDGGEAAPEPPAAAQPEESPELPTEPQEPLNWDHIEELVAELTERIDSMGPVNLEAIQEYEELEQRQNFLEKQNEDLVNSKTELLEVISKINRTTKELFAETFVKIRENFQFMFNELFGGGRANLMLMDDSDPLECGIEIIAKPPGKQLQSISLLSGGERTMTAVALLFAIYMVKPSPFCVLDEMDAPLDESNISRFVKILDRFVGQSQFVVITHNKRTISRADMLYGVTMEEHGVSKLVSVKFTTKEESAAKGTEQPKSVAEVFGKHGDLQSERERAEFGAAPEEKAEDQEASVPGNVLVAEQEPEEAVLVDFSAASANEELSEGETVLVDLSADPVSDEQSTEDTVLVDFSDVPVGEESPETVLVDLSAEPASTDPEIEETVLVDLSIEPVAENPEPENPDDKSGTIS